MTTTYIKRQDNLIDNYNMIEVSYVISKRQGCIPVIGYEYFKTFINATKRAKELVSIGKHCIVSDFAGRCEEWC